MGLVAVAAMFAAAPTRASPCAQSAHLSAGSPIPTRPKAPLQITFFGVSTLLFSAGEDQILIDGFFSRPTAIKTIAGRVGPDEPLIERRLRDARVGRLHAILVAHGHHDHALDTASVTGVSRRIGQGAAAGPVVIGSLSTIRLVMANGVDASSACAANRGDQYLLGPFRVTAYRVAHGPAPWFLRRLLTGDMAEAQPLPARFNRLKDTENFSYLVEYGDRRILVHPSAGQFDGAAPKAELVFLGVGGLGVAPGDYASRYWRRMQAETQAQTFIPIHWDRFTTPLEAGFSYAPWPFDRIGRTFQALERDQGDNAICFLEPLGQLQLPAWGEAPAINGARSGRPRLAGGPTCHLGPVIR